MKVRLHIGWANTYSELTLGNVYRVLAISDGYIRLVGDDGRPSLFALRAFIVVDPTLPADWQVLREPGEVVAGPAEFIESGFFERLFDGDPKSQQVFHSHLREWCRREREAEQIDPNRYLNVLIRGEHDTSHTVLVELDDRNMEVRKISIAATGSISFADANGAQGDIVLLDAPGYASDTSLPGISIARINRSEFELAWSRAIESDL